MLSKEGRLKGLLLLLAMVGITLTSVVAGVKPAGADPAAISFGSSWSTTNPITINACSMTGAWLGDNCGGQAPVGLAWQCVELVQRAYQLNGWHTGVFPNVSYAYQTWSSASGSGMSMTTYANGASDLTIVPGDMIVHNYAADDLVHDPIGSYNAGHVNIVDSISGSTINVVEQNWGSSTIAHRGSYALTGHTLSRSDITDVKDPAGHVLPILGVVHSPLNQSVGGTVSNPHTIIGPDTAIYGKNTIGWSGWTQEVVPGKRRGNCRRG